MIRMLWRQMRGRCIDCGVNEALPMPRLRAIGVIVPGLWCRNCHPRWHDLTDSRCQVVGCQRHASLSGCHALCKLHENGPCARCRQLAGELIPLTSACFPVNR